MEVLQRLEDAVFVVKFVSNNVNSVGELVAEDCDFVVESDETDSLEWIVFLDFLELGFDGA